MSTNNKDLNFKTHPIRNNLCAGVIKLFDINQETFPFQVFYCTLNMNLDEDMEWPFENDPKLCEPATEWANEWLIACLL